jgi:hypothetical protein
MNFVSPSKSSVTLETPEQLVRLNCFKVEKVIFNGTALSSEDKELVCGSTGYTVKNITNGSNELIFEGFDSNNKKVARLTLTAMFDESAYNMRQKNDNSQQVTSTDTIDTTASKIKLLKEFEKTDFYSKYQFTKGDSWDIKTGGRANTYNTDYFGKGMAGFDIVTINDVATEFGFADYGTTKLSDKHKYFINDLLKMISGETNIDASYSFVISNISKPVKDRNTSITQTSPFAWKGLKIYAASVGSTLHLYIDAGTRERPTEAPTPTIDKAQLTEWSKKYKQIKNNRIDKAISTSKSVISAYSNSGNLYEARSIAKDAQDYFSSCGSLITELAPVPEHVKTTVDSLSSTFSSYCVSNKMLAGYVIKYADAGTPAKQNSALDSITYAGTEVATEYEYLQIYMLTIDELLK